MVSSVTVTAQKTGTLPQIFVFIFKWLWFIRYSGLDFFFIYIYFISLKFTIAISPEKKVNKNTVETQNFSLVNSSDFSNLSADVFLSGSVKHEGFKLFKLKVYLLISSWQQFVLFLHVGNRVLVFVWFVRTGCYVLCSSECQTFWKEWRI